MILFKLYKSKKARLEKIKLDIYKQCLDFKSMLKFYSKNSLNEYKLYNFVLFFQRENGTLLFGYQSGFSFLSLNHQKGRWSKS